jgi:acetylornithine deacetylase
LDEVTELLGRLIAIDSVNPGLVTGAPGEGEIARFIASWMERAGLDVNVSDVAPGRPNVIGTVSGSGGGRSLMLNAHMDTVGHAGMVDPLVPRIEGNRMHGRGSYDMKGGLAASMLAGARAVQRGLAGDFIVAAVADEEVASLGTSALLNDLPDAAIVAEPTEMSVAIAHKGFVAFEIETKGTAAHGSRPDLGRDAIALMGRVLVRLGELDRTLRSEGSHALLGSGSIHASLIEGGKEYSSYPEHCLLRGERRTVPAETVEHVEGEIVQLLGDVDGEARVMFSREPFEVNEQEPLVELVRSRAGHPDLVGVAYWADSSLLAEAGVPTVLFGPSGAGAHGNTEWVDTDDVARCADVYLAIAEEFCR